MARNICDMILGILAYLVRWLKVYALSRIIYCAVMVLATFCRMLHSGTLYVLCEYMREHENRSTNLYVWFQK